MKNKILSLLILVGCFSCATDDVELENNSSQPVLYKVEKLESEQSKAMDQITPHWIVKKEVFKVTYATNISIQGRQIIRDRYLTEWVGLRIIPKIKNNHQFIISPDTDIIASPNMNLNENYDEIWFYPNTMWLNEYGNLIDTLPGGPKDQANNDPDVDLCLGC